MIRLNQPARRSPGASDSLYAPLRSLGALALHLDLSSCSVTQLPLVVIVIVIAVALLLLVPLVVVVVVAGSTVYDLIGCHRRHIKAGTRFDAGRTAAMLFPSAIGRQQRRLRHYTQLALDSGRMRPVNT